MAKKMVMMNLSVKVMGLVILGLLIESPVMNAITCEDGIRALLPCEAFLVGSGPAHPSPECCISAQSLNKMANSTEARRTLCQCFKDTAGSFGVKDDRAKKLPSLCDLHISIDISPQVDCKTIPRTVAWMVSQSG